MIKLAQLFLLIDNFSKDAIWDYRLVKQAKTSQNLLAQADEFENNIKDEELFNQFEGFISAYKELVDTLSITSNNLNPESLEDAAELIDTLRTRYDRIMTNPYLNATEDEGYEEEFDPGTFTKFLSDVAQDAENKLKNAAGEDIDISEVRANQYAKEFNAIQEQHAGTKQDEWSAYRVQKALEARKAWYEDLMARKKLNINDPKYQSYIESRRRAYQAIVADPERRTIYREKARQRQAKFSKKLEARKKEIELLIGKTNDPKKIEILRNELATIEAGLAHRYQKSKDVALKIREKKQAGNLDSLVIHLQQRLASYKKDLKTTLKKKASKDPYFNSFKEAVRVAKQAVDADNSPTNQGALAQAIKNEEEALVSYLTNNPRTQAVAEHFPVIYAYRDEVSQLNKLGWLDQELISEELKPHLAGFIEKGQQLINNYQEVYPNLMEIVAKINNLIQQKLQRS